MKKSIFLVLLVSSAFFLLGNRSILAEEDSSALGVSPGTVKNEILLPGTEFREEFQVSRGDVSKRAEITIDVIAEGFEDWIELPTGLEHDISSGQQSKNVPVIFKIPEGASLGRYSGAIRFKLTEPSSEGQVIVVPAVRVDLHFEVINEEKRGLEVRLASIEDFCSNESLHLKLKLKNNGNVVDRLEKVNLQVTNITGVKLATFEFGDFPDLQPFSVSEHTINFSDHGLSTGDYFSIVRVYDQGGSIFDDKLAFSVLDECVLSGKIEDVEEQGSSSNLFKIFGTILVASGFIFLIVMLLRRKSQYNSER